MKEKKENIRSFRYSNKVAELLEAAPGDNMSEKFENLVLLSSRTLPDLQKSAEFWEHKVENEKERYYALTDLNSNLEKAIDRIMEVKRVLDKAVEDM